MIYSINKKFIIISIIAIIININIDHGIVNKNNLTKYAFKWTKLYLTKIVLKINIHYIKKTSHKKWNKLIKIINGNRFYKKPVKQKRHFKFVTWNKGNSHLNSESEIFLSIQTEILNQNGDIVVLSEAEFNPKDKDHIKGEFPNYDHHYKLIPGATKARIMMMVKKDTINITRINKIEEPASACMWFKIKTEDIRSGRMVQAMGTS